MSENGFNNVAADKNGGVLHRYWHALARSAEVGEKPVAARLLDTPIALWRSNGTVRAFHDLCIHRGTPLSLGWVDGAELVCAYHGWRYGADGLCTRIPALPKDRSIPAKARANSYHVQEKYGLIWVCLGEPCVDIPEFPAEYGDASYRWEVLSSQGQWHANAARLIENLADFTHFPWVHPGILGDPDNPESPPINIESLEDGFQYDIETPVNSFTGGAAPIQRYRVVLPFMLIITRWQPDGPERQTNIYLCAPLSSAETRFYRLAGRNYRDRLSDDELNERHRTIFEQDRRILEAQRPQELPLDLAEELHLKGPDLAAVEYRRRLRDLGIDWQ